MGSEADDTTETPTSAVQSPSTALLASPSRHLNLADLELLHHYIAFTCVASNQKPEATLYIQRTVPVLAQTHHFVMHGILAQAATHLSRLRPSSSMHYSMLAKMNHGRSLPTFRAALDAGLSSDNYLALVLYSKTLLWCSMASNQKRPDNLDANTGAENNAISDWIPTWFHLLRGSCSLVELSRSLVATEELEPHVHPILRDSSRGYALLPHASSLNEQQAMADVRLLTDQERLTQLSLRLQTTTMTQKYSRSLSLAPVVLSALGKAFVCASRLDHNTPYRNALNFWAASIPSEYVDLLREREPWALVVMAHFAILLHRSETVWFMKGHAAQLLTKIVDFLGVTDGADGYGRWDWREWVRWPVEEIGLAFMVP